jgi:hypothetical protein
MCIGHFRSRQELWIALKNALSTYSLSSLIRSYPYLKMVRLCAAFIYHYDVDLFASLFNNKLKNETLGEDCGNEIDRVELCLSLLGSKCSKYSPLAVTLGEYAFTLLQGLSLHLLGVTALSDDICEAISVLSHHLGMIVLGDTSARKHPPSPADVFSTDVIGIQMGVLQSLSPYISDYFVWLQDHKKPFVQICRSLEVVQFIHPALRKSLQNEEFSSPKDIIKKYEGKYKRHLTRMPLPIQLFQREDILQVCVFHMCEISAPRLAHI